MPSLLRRSATALLAVVALVVGTAVPASPAAPPPIDALTVLGQGGWPVFYATRAFGPPDPWRVRVLWGAAGHDRLDVVGEDSSTTHVSLEIAAPVGRPRLEPGHYTARGSEDMVHAGLDISSEVGTCSQTEGSFDVLGLTRAHDGTLTSLALDYRLTCHDQAPVSGSLRWNSDVPYAYTTVTSFISPDLGPRQAATGSVTLTNAGVVPQTYGPTRWWADRFIYTVQSPPRITRDGCAGVTLAPGGSCTVEVTIVADAMRSTEGYLVTPDATPRGGAVSLVRMRAVPGPTPVTVVATPRRGGVELSTAYEENPTYRVLRAGADGAETEVASGVPLPWTDRSGAPGAMYRYRVVPQSGGLTGEPTDAVVSGSLPVPRGEEGTFVPVGPVRVVDTRTGMGAPRAPVGPGRTLRFDPAAGGHLPRSGVSAVLLNVTGTESTAVTHLRVWPAGRPRPETSSLNLVPHQSRPGQVVVPLGDDGQVELFNNAGTTHVVVDVQGFYSTADGPHGGGYHPVEPTRVVDMRNEPWRPQEAGAKNGARVGDDDLIGPEAVAVEVNITVTRPTAAGHLTAWAGDTPTPLVSNLNYEAGQTIANHAVVPVSRDKYGNPAIAFTHSGGAPQVIVDVLGWYDADALDADECGDDGCRALGLRFRPTPAARVVDTRTMPGGARTEPGQAVVVPGTALPPGVAHVVNVTATGAGAGGHLTAWRGEGILPGTSTVNFGREDSTNLTTAATGADGRFAVTVGSSGVHVVVDHVGFFY